MINEKSCVKSVTMSTPRIVLPSGKPGLVPTAATTTESTLIPVNNAPSYNHLFAKQRQVLLLHVPSSRPSCPLQQLLHHHLLPLQPILLHKPLHQPTLRLQLLRSLVTLPPLLLQLPIVLLPLLHLHIHNHPLPTILRFHHPLITKLLPLSTSTPQISLPTLPSIL